MEEREEKRASLRKEKASSQAQGTKGFGKLEITQRIKQQKNPEVKKVSKGERSLKVGS